MDLESESSALESVEDNEGIVYTSHKLLDDANDDESTVVATNGIHVEEANRVHESRNVNVIVGVDSGLAVESPAAGATGKSSPSSPSTGGPYKGRGLKKWRRIKRDVVKEGGSHVDVNKLLKRGLPNSGVNSNHKPVQFSGGTKQNNSEGGSVSSTDALLRNYGNGFDLFAAFGDPRVVGAGVVNENVNDSENSEDRSSKSSTAASIPKMPGYTFERNSMRNLSGKNLVNTVPQGKIGKARSETSKKFRGEMVKIEKENSQSSMESDSRSSNFLFMQGLNSSVTSNGRRSGRSQNYDGVGNSDEAQGSDRQPSEEPQVGSSGNNGVTFGDNNQEELAADSSWRTKDRENENNDFSRDEDPLLDSIASLQLAKEALEKEIHKFMEIGKEDSTSDDSSQLHSTDVGDKSFDSSEPEGIDSMQTMRVLESKLDDAEALLKVKEATILELQESTSYHGKNTMTETALDTELETLFKQKIEAEVEYLAISRKVQNLRVSLVDQIGTILVEQKAQETRILNKLEDSEDKAAKLKVEAEQLENRCEEIVSANETMQLKTKVYKYTWCFLTQLILLFAIILLFIWQFMPSYPEVVPT
ncbi:OLC1v1022352C1 [Oldenlandia corymbosa var. corymbosa]|uniref:OLC1v1022352C1 n=1 Tax=Oldenlandia corymbosa var. corymbosa TaxID=529605 RepID=A0AAV1C013_OLDCO|nr:OLC1v1022352C1 [Oldenlandia corymbosa var. corymbosa]